LFDRVSFNPITVTAFGHSVSDSAIDKLIDTTRLEETTWQVVVDEHNQVAEMLLGNFICVGNSAHEIILKDTSHEITGVNTLLKESLK
jgi:aminopeptidase-like protein